MAGMSCIEPEAEDAGVDGLGASAGACASVLPGDATGAFRFFSSAGDGAPRFRTGRLGSSSGAAGTVAEAAGAEATGAAGAEAVGAGAEDLASGLDSTGAVDCGGSVGFAELARLNTGGPSTGSGAGFDWASFFFAAAAAAVASALADCQVPSPIHVLLDSRAPETVNNPAETPARTPSYTVPLSSAMGTGAALYALAS